MFARWRGRVDGDAELVLGARRVDEPVTGLPATDKHMLVVIT